MRNASSRPDRADLDAYGPTGAPEWLDVDWSRHQKWVPVGGRHVNVIDLGEGPETLVFVHGLSGSWPNWLENLPHFARSHRVVAPMAAPVCMTRAMRISTLPLSAWVKVP